MVAGNITFQKIHNLNLSAHRFFAYKQSAFGSYDKIALNHRATVVCSQYEVAKEYYTIPHSLLIPNLAFKIYLCQIGTTSFRQVCTWVGRKDISLDV